MRTALRWALLLVAAGCVALPAARAGGRARRPPNVVLLFADDMGYGDLGCFGAPSIRTPHLDQLARNGVRFTDFYVAQAVCSASRAALLTGCYSNRVSILGALGPAARHGLHRDETTLAELLKPRGYATAIYGKWHLGHHPVFLPTRHGFDEYYGLPYSNDMWPRHPTARFPDLPLIEGEATIQTNPDQSRLTVDYTERAVRFIEKNKDRPFLVYLAYAMPHVPLFVSERRAGKSAGGLYGDVIEEIDDSVGRITETLSRLGLDRHTLVVFTSDNGPWLSYGNHAGSPGPFREGKGTSFEGGVRVPFVARWTGRIPAGRTIAEPAMTIDLLPTIARLAGAPLPDRKIDGRDLSPLLLGNGRGRAPEHPYFFYYGAQLQAVRQGRWKLHVPHPYQAIALRGRDGRPGRYLRRDQPLALYDLVDDPGESRNVSSEHPDVVRRLQALVEGMRSDLGDEGRRGPGVREPERI